MKKKPEATTRQDSRFSGSPTLGYIHEERIESFHYVKGEIQEYKGRAFFFLLSQTMGNKIIW